MKSPNLEYHNKELATKEGIVYAKILDYICVKKPDKCNCGKDNFKLNKNPISFLADWICEHCGKEYRVENG